MNVEATDSKLTGEQFAPTSSVPVSQTLGQAEAQSNAMPTASAARVGIADFDWYERLGVALAMYGWWKVLSHHYLAAVIALALGCYLAFSQPQKRDHELRLLRGAVAKVVDKLIKALGSAKERKE